MWLRRAAHTWVARGIPLPYWQLAGATEDGCIEVERTLAGVTTTYMINPIDVFPAGHALVQGTICGQTFNAGDPIPSIARLTPYTLSVVHLSTHKRARARARTHTQRAHTHTHTHTHTSNHNPLTCEMACNHHLHRPRTVEQVWGSSCKRPQLRDSIIGSAVLCIRASHFIRV